MKNFGNSSRGHSQGVPKIFRAPTYRAHCAVIFAIAQLAHEVYILKFTRLRAVSRRQHGSCLLLFRRWCRARSHLVRIQPGWEIFITASHHDLPVPERCRWVKEGEVSDSVDVLADQSDRTLNSRTSKLRHWHARDLTWPNNVWPLSSAYRSYRNGESMCRGITTLMGMIVTFAQSLSTFRQRLTRLFAKSFPGFFSWSLNSIPGH